MNELAAWGFATPEALERHVMAGLPKVEQPERRKGEYVSTAVLVKYAKDLGRLPTVQEIRDHYGCMVEAARKRRYRLAKAWKAA